MSFNLHQLISRKQTIYNSWLDCCHCDYRKIVGVVKDNTNLIDVGDMIEEWTAAPLQGSESQKFAVQFSSIVWRGDGAALSRKGGSTPRSRGHWPWLGAHRTAAGPVGR